MANIISGKIIGIGQTQTIQSSKGGNPLIKRELVLQALRFNPNDGTPELDEYNTPILEVRGQDNCNMLDKFRVGMCVKVAFALEGRKTTNKEKEGAVRFFNTARAYSIEEMQVSLPEQAQPAQTQEMSQPTQPAQGGASHPQHISEAAQQFGFPNDNQLPF
ncbi:MAG: DUF3127 domain-containing protein [Bacteroidaceae bacterium]|nr:DUF3127 domain-containing protein [Bacteroidaceae bacterium]